MSLFVRFIIFLGGIVASFFISKEAVEYPYIQMIFALLCLTVIFGVLVFSPEIKKFFFRRGGDQK